jgi:hypothetical protein
VDEVSPEPLFAVPWRGLTRSEFPAGPSEEFSMGASVASSLQAKTDPTVHRRLTKMVFWYERMTPPRTLP